MCLFIFSCPRTNVQPEGGSRFLYRYTDRKTSELKGKGGGCFLHLAEFCLGKRMIKKIMRGKALHGLKKSAALDKGVRSSSS